jgi:hypothetical protein
MGTGPGPVGKHVAGALALALALKAAATALSALAPLSILFLVACADLATVMEPPSAGRSGAAARAEDATGSAGIRITLAPLVAGLAKKADTTVTLDTLHLLLTSPGCPSRSLDIPVSGNIHGASLALAARVDSLKGLRNWKVKAWTRDLADSVIHSDSTTFYVQPGDTGRVSLLLNPRYAVLVARFVSTSNSVTAIEKLVLRVGGVVVDDTVFATRRRTFDVRLSHKYLKAGASATVKLEALDRASPARIRYSHTLSVAPNSARDTTLTVQLL